MTMNTKVRVTPCQGAIDRAFACMILSRMEGGRLSIHTRAALESIARRLLNGEAVSPAEWQETVYAYFASKD
jgi:hypothetical protein